MHNILKGHNKIKQLDYYEIHQIHEWLEVIICNSYDFIHFIKGVISFIKGNSFFNLTFYTKVI
jgi:hypothetical protein